MLTLTRKVVIKQTYSISKEDFFKDYCSDLTELDKKEERWSRICESNTEFDDVIMKDNNYDDFRMAVKDHIGKQTGTYSARMYDSLWSACDGDIFRKDDPNYKYTNGWTYYSIGRGGYLEKDGKVCRIIWGDPDPEVTITELPGTTVTFHSYKEDEDFYGYDVEYGTLVIS
jgi:hypothetical protein